VQPDASTDRLADEQIGERYQIQALLGHGGMARVFRVLDSVTDRQLALKQLTQKGEHDERVDAVALFENEFHVLSQLNHPCVIKVYDYGVCRSGPYYTMELLDGGDLRERAPLPWREACRFFFGICSSLALLHSRRLIHRDISPRNIRCTQDGTAKLIDFGAMLPMGPTRQIVGTPAFVAPEAVQGLALDGRADLFSLGATLYFALTGQAPSQARDFSQVLALSQAKPTTPSRLVQGLPHALDHLVLSLIDPEPGARPRTAFEVMQRLAAAAGMERSEPVSVAQAYLTTPVMVGRDETRAKLRERIERALQGRGGTLVIEAKPGMGRSRMLDVCALDAMTAGATVLRTRAAAAGPGEFAGARALIEPLLGILPEPLMAALRAEHPSFDQLIEPAVPQQPPTGEPRRQQLQFRSWKDSDLTRSAIHAALAWFVVRVAQERPLLVAVDDIHMLDASSAALLAALSHRTRRRRLLFVLTLEQGAARKAPGALTLIEERSPKLQLRPLSSEETGALFDSVFGDIPNVALLSHRIHAISAGNPAESLELAQYLADRKIIRYEGGNWTLPSELEIPALPSSAAEALRTRLAVLSALARQLAETQALALSDGFTREDYLALAPDRHPDEIDAALTELDSQRVVDSDGETYAFSHRAWSKLLSDGIGDVERVLCHRALAQRCQRRHKPVTHVAHHLLCAGLEADALDAMLAALAKLGDTIGLGTLATFQVSPSQLASILARCLAAAQTLRRSAREEYALRRWMTAVSVLCEDDYYLQAAPAWRKQLERDSGLLLWRERSAVSDPGERLRLALQAAFERYNASPEHERVYAPDEAIRLLVAYVTFSIAVGARRLDTALIDSLPPLLEPFAPLSPLIHAIWQTALGTRESLCTCRVERARARWLDVLAQLENVTGADASQAALIRDALAYAIGSSEAGLGLQSAARWANVLDHNAVQAVSAMYLRKVLRLQQGDFEGADRFRRKAELLEVQADNVQMFTATLTTELILHAVAGDLTGVKQLADRIASISARCPSWLAYQHLAEGYFERLRGNPAAACDAFSRCLTLSTPSALQPHVIYAWPRAMAGKAEALLDLGRYVEARDLAQAGVDRCKELGIGVLSHDITRGLALAEAKLGEHARAAQRIEAVIAQALELGIVGLNLGVLYEARTRIAIWAGDRVGLERYARMTAREYRHGRGSPLAARYERLLEEANQMPGAQLPPLGPADSQAPPAFGVTASAQLNGEIAQAMAGAEHAEGRAQRALRLLCDSHGAFAGHLYLIGPDGLKLAASLGAKQADAALFAMAQERLEQDLRGAGSSTSTTRGTVNTTAFWTDVNGRAYQPRLLSCVVDGVPLCAGVLILAQGRGRPRTKRLMQFTAALSAYLVQAGESIGA
jgi:hypothetical protein